MFDIITSPTGSSNFSLPLSCATVELHYHRTTGVQEEDSGKCSTGLRVYEGAQVLAAFLFQYLKVLVGPLPHQSSNESVIVIELGCGCGLAGFCAAHCMKEKRDIIKIIFTDASSECLSLVRSSGVLQGIVIEAGLERNHSMQLTSPEERRSRLHGITFPLVWGEESQVPNLHEMLSRFFFDSSQSSYKDILGISTRVPLILGSDLMYYRVDVDHLVSTVARLLTQFSSKTDLDNSNTYNNDIPGLAVLSHFMRMSNGRKQLWSSCQFFGLGIVSVNLSAFLDPSVVLSRGWGGLEVVLMFFKSSGKREKMEETESEILEKKNEIDKGDVAKAKKILQGRIELFPGNEESSEKQRANKLLLHIEPYTFDTVEESLFWPCL